MIIASKREFYRLWRAGVLGNRTGVWDNVEDALASGAREIGFREVGKAGGGAWAKVPREDARRTARVWLNLGRSFVCDDAVPNSRSTLQGEVCRTIRGLEGYLAVGYPIPPMRVAFAQGLNKHYGYLETKMLLDRFMDPCSRNDLDDLLELYPDATIEFTCFNVNVGNIPGRNTIMWETRNY